MGKVVLAPNVAFLYEKFSTEANFPTIFQQLKI